MYLLDREIKHSMMALMLFGLGSEASPKDVWAVNAYGTSAQLTSISTPWHGIVEGVETTNLSWVQRNMNPGSGTVPALIVRVKISENARHLRWAVPSPGPDLQIGERYLFLVSRKIDDRVRYFNEPTSLTPTDWLVAPESDGGLIAAVRLEVKGPLGEKKGPPLVAFAEGVGTLLSSVDVKELDEGLAALHRLGLLELERRWKSGNPPEDAATASRVREVLTTALSKAIPQVSGFVKARLQKELVHLGDDQGKAFWETAIAETKHSGFGEDFQAMIDDAPAGPADLLIDLAIRAPLGPARNGILVCMVGPSKRTIKRLVGLLHGPNDEQSRIVLQNLAFNIKRPDLSPKILRYERGKPVYEDLRALIEMWRKNPPVEL